MSFDFYAEVCHARYRDKIWNKIEGLGFKITKPDTELSDDDLKSILKTIRRYKNETRDNNKREENK